MPTEQLDPRQQLAKMEAEVKAAQDKAKKAEEDFEEKSKELKAKLREADLADVLAKCELHGFTLTDVKKGLRTKGAKKATPRKSTARKTTARKSTARKKAA